MTNHTILHRIPCSFIGCGNLYVADGNWKLRYAHCMWKVPIKLDGFGKINYPNICPLTPKRGHAFCETHCKTAERLCYPTKLREFLKKCGVLNTDVDEGLLCTLRFTMDLKNIVLYEIFSIIKCKVVD
jgi:hypothetical protein